MLENKWKIVALVLITLALLGALYYGAWAIHNKAYNNGVKDGGNYVLQNVATSQTQYGEIWITNGTAITTMPITQICQNLGERAK